jgi:hypothetical protein
MSAVTSPFADASVLLTVVWRDLVVVVDNGHAPASDYLSVAREVNQQSHAHPSGRGLIVVLPPLTRPPPPEVRDAIRQAYALVGPQLRAAAWVIEGTGFRAATVRAALAGLRSLMRLPFPTTVTSSYEVAVPFVLGHLPSRSSQSVEPEAVITAIKRDLDQIGTASRMRNGRGSGSRAIRG